MATRLVVILTLLFSGFSFAQYTTVNSVGPDTILNIYAPVTNIDCPSNSINIGGANPGFGVGDTVILMQMQGATIDETNSSTYGDITDIGNAGKYEVLIISAISLPTITFQYQMLNSYDATGSVQLISFPTYLNLNLQAKLTAPPWDGQIGGVVAVQATNQILFHNTEAIKVELWSHGFSGGTNMLLTASCGCGSSYPDYYYPNVGAANSRAAEKGDGIANTIANKEMGRGKQASGGGGGNDHNTGGAGGANYGGGGNGGRRDYPDTPWWCGTGVCRGDYGGIGGTALNGYYSNAENRIFMGGGGGCGHSNNVLTTDGTNGGGIAIFRANEIHTHSGYKEFRLQGRNITFVAGGDGNSGAGAGGTLLMEANSYIGTGQIRAYVQGGNGGTHNWGGGTNNCMGPGGGGGGGVFWYSTTPTTYLFNGAGGATGVNTGSTCNGETNGATAGGNGVEMNGLVIPQSATLPNGCVLPVGFASFKGLKKDEHVELKWITITESNNDHFVVERSQDSEHFDPLGTVKGAGTTSGTSRYGYMDPAPQPGVNYYRLKQVDLNGSSSYSAVIEVNYDFVPEVFRSLYPNPVANGESVIAELYLERDEKVKLEVFDMMGRVVYTDANKFDAGAARFNIQTSGWDSGIYFVKVSGPTTAQTKRLTILR